MELMNSAVERAVDKPDTTHWWSAGAAKDMAAGGVLFMALGALAAGLCLLAPRLPVIWGNLCRMPAVGAGGILLLGPVYWFIFRYRNAEKKGETPNGKTDP